MAVPDPGSELRRCDVIVVGAGFSGMYLLHHLRERGFDARAIEAGGDVGGTWYWNRYPGARCDIESLAYSYSFDEAWQQEWRWKERYSVQPDILDYARAFAERFDLRRDIHFETRVRSARFDPERNEWTLATDRGSRFVAPFCVMATGCLSVPKVPDLPGIDDFEGERYHTARWPHETVDFSGKRTGIIGTGSSAVQSIPVIARQAKHLTVFQRTPNFSIPAWQGPLTDEEDRRTKRDYAKYRAISRRSICGDFAEENVMALLEATPGERERELEKRWRLGGFHYQYAFSDALTDPEANAIAADFVRDRIRERVHDPEVAEILCPRDHPFGTKRLCVDTDYYETFNRDNVTLVDLRRTPISNIGRRAVVTSAAELELDALVLATGFDAMTGALTSIDIRGPGGVSLEDEWEGGARSYLGLAVAGFPNLFTVTGPGSPSVLANMMVAIEQHVQWIVGCLSHLREHGIERIEARAEAQQAWVEHVNESAERTLYPRANSWYVGANVPGKARVFLPYVNGVKTYDDICERVRAKGYEGFRLDRGGSARARAHGVASQSRR